MSVEQCGQANAFFVYADRKVQVCYELANFFLEKAMTMRADAAADPGTPAEETVPGGAVDVIAEGWFADVSSVYGLHCDPKLDSGYVGLRTGAITSATPNTTASVNPQAMEATRYPPMATHGPAITLGITRKNRRKFWKTLTSF